MTPPPPSLGLFLAAAPSAPGAAAVLRKAHEAAAGGRRVRAILSGSGLEWTSEDALAAFARLEHAELCLCSQSARRGGLTAEALPAWIRWSSVAAWLGGRTSDEELWGVFP